MPDQFAAGELGQRHHLAWHRPESFFIFLSGVPAHRCDPHGFCALSGFYLIANHFKFPASRIDFAFLLLVAVAFVLQIFLGIYLSFYFMGKVAHPSPASFVEFISLYVTRVKHAMRLNSHTQDAVAAGEAGWYLLMIQLMALCAVARTIYGATNRSGNAQWETKF
ncbi:hypothetical protein [Undibacterium sp. Tian12W]|uniref:hypothetical protein n=1 Tax=Undibacterium sp. Tian12W TaxID=3413054 RepID=UPI003BF482DF